MSDWSSTRRFYESEYWQQLSRRVRERDGWRCRRCGVRATSGWQRRRMQAHHVVSRPHVAYRTPLDVMSNLVCVCADCHRAVHGLRPAAVNTHQMRVVSHAVVATRALPAPRPLRPSTPGPRSHRSSRR